MISRACASLQRLHAQRERSSPFPASLGSPRDLEGPATALLGFGAPRKPCSQPRKEAEPGEIEGRGFGRTFLVVGLCMTSRALLMLELLCRTTSAYVAFQTTRRARSAPTRRPSL